MTDKKRPLLRVEKIGRRMAKDRLDRMERALADLGALLKELRYEDELPGGVEDATKDARAAAREAVELVAPILCADEEKRLVYGLVYSPDVEDTHGEMADAATIEAAAHGFMESRLVGIQHEKEAPASVVESYIAQADIVIGDQHVPKGSWLVVIKIQDEELWAQVKSGAFAGISMGGWASRQPDPATQLEVVQ